MMGSHWHQAAPAAESDEDLLARCARICGPHWPAAERGLLALGQVCREYAARKQAEAAAIETEQPAGSGRVAGVH